MTGTDDALAAMVAATQARKAEASAKLTPVSGEKPLSLTMESHVEIVPANPVDLGAILRTIDATERGVNGLFAILRGEVRRLIPVVPAPGMELDEGAYLAAMGVDVAVAAAKRVFGDDIYTLVVDEGGVKPATLGTFAEDFEAKSKLAQAGFFKPESGSPAEGWVCSVHGDTSIENRSTMKGLKFRACTACREKELAK